MTILEKIQNLTWFDLVSKLKDLLVDLSSGGAGTIEEIPYEMNATENAAMNAQYPDAKIGTILFQGRSRVLVLKVEEDIWASSTLTYLE